MKKKILIGLAVLMVLQISWLIFCNNYYSTGYVKTTATVVDLGYYRQGAYPVYEYFDASGKQYIVSDKYSGAMNKANILYPIFGSEIGDRVTLYYDKDNPSEFDALAGVWTFAVLFLPVFAVMLPVLFTAVILFVFKLKTFNRSTGRFE